MLVDDKQDYSSQVRHRAHPSNQPMSSVTSSEIIATIKENGRVVSPPSSVHPSDRAALAHRYHSGVYSFAPNSGGTNSNKMSMRGPADNLENYAPNLSTINELEAKSAANQEIK